MDYPNVIVSNQKGKILVYKELMHVGLFNTPVLTTSGVLIQAVKIGSFPTLFCDSLNMSRDAIHCQMPLLNPQSK